LFGQSAIAPVAEHRDFFDIRFQLIPRSLSGSRADHPQNSASHRLDIVGVNRLARATLAAVVTSVSMSATKTGQQGHMATPINAFPCHAVYSKRNRAVFGFGSFQLTD
jgi:hypothetical protein